MASQGAKVFGVSQTKTRIRAEIDGRIDNTFDLFKHYAAEILLFFMVNQGDAGKEERGLFWTNHTFKAVRSFFTHAYKTKIYSGVTLGYDTDIAWYTQYLEDNGFGALDTLIETFYPLIEEDLKQLWGQ